MTEPAAVPAVGGHPASVPTGTVPTVTVTANGVRVEDVLAVARGNARVEIAPEALAAMRASRSIVEKIEREERPVYGVSTGFGALASTFVAADRRAELQHALVRSHAAGIGAPMPREVVRAMMLLRVRSLALGLSGVRPLVARALTDLLNHDITPWVPEHGSLGASGDLAPLAHCALVLLGEGWVLGKDGARAPGAEALHAAGLRPIELSAKEGLALINGTDGMLGMLLLAIHDARHLFTMADVTAALATEAMLGSDRPFLPELHTIRPHPGQAVSAANMYRLLQGSAIMDSHRDDMQHAVQDAYSIRCAPQVAGAARDTLDFAALVAGRELVSVVDNPVVLADGRVLSTGNFHGAPLGFAADYLAIAAAEVGAIAERRVDRLLDVCRSRDLPAFLTPDAGVNSGLMIAQYTAAGIVAENRRLAGPASVDSVPTSGMQEDHVSMGWAAAVKLRRVLDNLTSILAVELVAAVRGLQLRAPLSPSPAGRAAIAAVAPFAGEPGPDIFLAPVLEAARGLIAGQELRSAIEAEVGPLS
ncbi:MAG TPA: histidine ammonia-lyase [Micromonosporaceae bacterium]|nr:histidine ammonia-lyase [Micromonosporaceae bacterium]